MARVNSPKQTKASRRNGSNSKGPKSHKGKARASQNAVKDGVFSRQVVIPQLGEEKTAFEAVKKRVWDEMRPAGVLEEMLVSDYVENWWRRERVRRAEQLDLETRTEVHHIRNRIEREDEVEKLKARFLVLYGRRITPTERESEETIIELEEVRAKLLSTSKGAGFLLEKLNKLREWVKKEGILSPEEEMLVEACCGVASLTTYYIRGTNLISKRDCGKWEKTGTGSINTTPAAAPPSGRSENEKQLLRLALQLKRETENLKQSATGKAGEIPKADGAEEAAKSSQTLNESRSKAAEAEGAVNSREDQGMLLATLLSVAIKGVRFRQQELQMIEAVQSKTELFTLVLEPTTTGRFARAEAAIERRMYRALGVLFATRAGNGPKLLPPKAAK